MKTIARIAAALVCAVCAVSCSTSRILVGDVKPKEPMVEVSKEHNAHFIMGLAKTGKTIAEEHVGDAQNYAVVTRIGFGDLVLSAVTAGIYTPSTTKYYIPIRYMDGYNFVGKPKERVHKDKGLTLMWNGSLAAGFEKPFFDDMSEDVDYCLADMSWAGSVAFGYRFNPHFFAGVGCGFSGMKYSVWDMDDLSFLALRPYVSLRYMVLDRKCTPFIGLDGGVIIPVGTYGSEEYCSRAWWNVEPQIGGQFRMGPNCYFDVSVGLPIARVIRVIDNKDFWIDDKLPWLHNVVSGRVPFPCNSLSLRIGMSFTL